MTCLKVVPVALLLLTFVVVEKVQCQTGLTDSDKQAILDAHNNFRSQVSPSASNMERMIWNDELAQVAQNYAEQCVFEHNNDRQSQQNTFSSVGENLAAGTGDADFPGFVQSWYDEVQAYDFGANSCSAVCGHYTQVVWATSRNVGCGAFRCADLQNFQPNSVNFVCNYGPAGNIIGQSPYLAGATCSACPDDVSMCNGGLCSAEGGDGSSGSNNNSGPASVVLHPLVVITSTLIAAVIISN